MEDPPTEYQEQVDHPFLILLALGMLIVVILVFFYLWVAVRGQG